MLRAHLSSLQLLCPVAALCINTFEASTHVRGISAAATSISRQAGPGGLCVRLRGGAGEGGRGGWKRKVMGQKEREARNLEESRFESLMALEERYSSQTRHHAEERVSRIQSVQATPPPHPGMLVVAEEPV